MVCITELNNALNFFHRDANLVAMRIARLIEGGDESFDGAISEAITLFLDRLPFEVTADAPTHVDIAVISASLMSYTVQSAPLVIDADEDKITVSVDVEAQIGTETEFDYWIRDGVDRAWTRLSREYSNVDTEHLLTMSITCDRQFAEVPEHVEAEVTTSYIDIDFGAVHPFDN